jgi:outer membrane protein TolC
MAEPILGQIKNISMSGLSDKAMILKAQQDYAKLEVANATAKGSVASAEAVFRESFPNANLRLLETLKKLNIETGENVKKIMFKRSASLRAQDILIRSFESEYDSLVAQKKPNVSVRAGVTAPAENTINDGSANVGFLVNYIFSDGGRLNSQIEALKLQIKVSYQQKKTTERELQLQLDVAMQAYRSSQKTYYAMSDLVNFSKEVRDTSRDQLVSGRSKIQDVLSAEVILAENRIQLLNAKTEETLSSYRIKALSHGLTKGLGWKPL